MSAEARNLLSGEELRTLSAPSDARGLAQLVLHLALLALSVSLVAKAGPWTLLPAMLLLGIVQAALFAPIHETMHMTAFASPWLNRTVGWFCACPSLLNWHFYTYFHLAHHRHTQDPEHDPELAALPTPTTLNGYVWRVGGAPYWYARLRVLRDGLRGDMSAYSFLTPRTAPRVIRSLRLMAAFVCGCAAILVATVGWWAPLLFWIGPQLLGQPFLRLYLLAEHTHCTLDNNGLTNTRTTLTNIVMRLLMWNMPFHTEHHLYPAIPFHRLSAAHALIRERLGELQNGYTRWHVGFVRSFRP